jgi:hypothetical protein
MSIRRQAALLGAFDRFNYGDLLFPIVAKNEMARHAPETKVCVHALVDSDLSRYGALPTRSLKSLYPALHDGDVIIFAGGGTIGVDWNHMHANLLGETGNLALYYLKRIAGDAFANRVSRGYFGARAPFPWVAGPQDFPVQVNVAYNAVGGSEFARLSPDIQKRTLARLDSARYVSVRDQETQRLFSSLKNKVELAPDSAILMSEQFPVDRLQEQASPALGAMLADGPYVCFQSNVAYAGRHAERIVAALEAIYEQHGLRALLLPIGRYVGLDDHRALENLRAKLRTPSLVVSREASLWEIMLVIARARLFLGTSLHGNVTSQSFAVPHLGLSDAPCKLDYYLGSWDLPEQASCARLDALAARVDAVLAVPDDARMKKRAELIARSHENFAKLMTACGLEWR